MANTRVFAQGPDALDLATKVTKYAGLIGLRVKVFDWSRGVDFAEAPATKAHDGIAIIILPASSQVLVK